MRRIIIIVAIVVILAISFLLMNVFMGMKQEPPEKQAETIRRQVKTENVVYGDISSESYATGRLGSNHSIDVMAEVSGKILAGRIPLKKGQKFKKGDLLLEIFDDEAEFNLKASKSRFLTSIANALPDARIDYPDRYDDLLAFFNSITMDETLPEMPEIQSPQIKTFLASRNILDEYYSIKSAEVRFEKYKIYAPFNGSFTDVLFEVGSIANMGTRIARIIRTDKLELEVPVPLEEIRWLKPGDNVEINEEDGSGIWKGTIVRVSDFVDASSQSASVFVGLTPSKMHPLYEGQYLRANFSGSIIPEVMEIPRSAVYNYNEVFVVKDEKLQKKIIEVVKINQQTLLFSGLEEGATVVIEPLVNASPGTYVDISE